MDTWVLPTLALEELQAVASDSRYRRAHALLTQASAKGTRRKEVHVEVEDRKEKHAFELQGEGRVYLYWV